MKGLQLACAIATLASAASATTGYAAERWQDPKACYLMTATFNESTLARFGFKEGDRDQPTAQSDIEAILADDPCLVLNGVTADGFNQLAAETLTPALLETPIDLLAYAWVNSDPYNVYVSAQYQPVQPSVYSCNVDPDTLKALDADRVCLGNSDQGCAAGQPAGDLAVLLWHDACGIAHISPSDILKAAADLANVANLATPSATIVAQYFRR